MKINKLTIILIIIILMLSGYIVYDKFLKNNNSNNLNYENLETISIIDELQLEYVKIYLATDGNAYIIPLNLDEIKELKKGENLSNRLTTLYNKAFYYDIIVNNYNIKGYMIKLDDDIVKIRKINYNDNIFIIFIKENHTIGVFSYLDYYNAMSTNVLDNYQDLKNVLEIENNKIIYLDGSSEVIDFKE